jgi:DNA-binding transcriptional regulator YhcF (GntR family)
LERDERRRPIIEFLCAGAVESMSVNQMRHHLGLPYGLIKRTLQQLERQGLVALHPGRYTYSIELKGPWARQAAPKPAPAVVSVQVRSVVATEAYPAIANP